MNEIELEKEKICNENCELNVRKDKRVRKQKNTTDFN